MKTHGFLILSVLQLFLSTAFAQPDVPSDAPSVLIKQIIRRVQTSITTEQNYGYHQDVVIRKLNGDGKPDKEERRIYKTIWIDGHPFNELCSVNAAPLNANQRSKELKRKAEFVKAVRGTKTKNGGVYQELQKVPWAELARGYRFTVVSSGPASGTSSLKFEPSGVQISERSRFQKILQHMTGTLIVDGEQNVVQANGRLSSPVRFGLGIIAKVEELEVHYRQQPHEGVWAPAELYLRFKARIAMLKIERQEILIRWYNPYPRPLMAAVATPAASDSGTPRD